LGFVSFDAATSQLSTALEYAVNGQGIKAAISLAKTPVAPITTILSGNRVLKEWLTPGSQGAEIAKIVDSMRMAGGRAKMDSFYQTSITKNMQAAFKEGRLASAAWRLPLSVLEQTAKPIMEYFVPRMKMGIFAEMARLELSRLPAGADDVRVRETMGKAWDSVDNRMGQMVYDNVFWNKTFKDLAMVSVRSVGWNLGTIRELGGAVGDFAKAGKATVTKGESAVFTHKMAYAIALPVMTGFLGAMTQYMLTGKGPDEMRDFFFPKTGQKDPQGRDIRLTLPSYMKDVYHYSHDPVKTVTGKIHPALSMTYQMLTNKDFFDRDIRNADDPIVKQMLDEAKFAATSLAPIGVKQFQQSSAAKTPPLEQAANFVGVTRAPAWIGESKAEQLAGKLAGDKFKSTKSPDSQLIADKGQIQVALRSGTDQEKAKAKQDLAKMVQDERLTSRQAKNLLRGVDHSYLENAVSHLDANEAMRVFKQSSQAERESISEAIFKKINNAHISTEDKKTLRDEFAKLMPERDPNTSYRK